jgi:uncharacterized protein YndB with AHSA1/START domain
MSDTKVDMPSDREVRVTRRFKAPAQLVWDAHTQPELKRKWLRGYDGWSMPVCDMDVRVGGAYRWRWRNNETGDEFGFFGTYLEVTAPGRLVFEEHYDPGSFGVSMMKAPVIVTHEFEEAGGITTLTVTMLFASRAERDETLATGATDGMEHNYKYLDEWLAR